MVIVNHGGADIAGLEMQVGLYRVFWEG